MNRLNSLKHVKHSDAHNFIQRKEKEKKKKENNKFKTFRHTCSITKLFELPREKFTDIGYDYN